MEGREIQTEEEGGEVNLEALLKKADKAAPEGRPANSRWLDVLPVYQRLRERKLTGKQAVNWLIQEKAISEDDRKKAEEALQKLQRRRALAAS